MPCCRCPEKHCFKGHGSTATGLNQYRISGKIRGNHSIEGSRNNHTQYSNMPKCTSQFSKYKANFENVITKIQKFLNLPTLLLSVSKWSDFSVLQETSMSPERAVHSRALGVGTGCYVE